jgi:hypothetical protein
MRALAVAVPALALGVLVVTSFLYFQRGFIPGDAHNYLAAGERLNAGHPLYALSPGDRYVALKPPYWSVPLLSPPPIAVLWRPLAALPGESGVALWWAAAILSVVGVVLALLRRRPVLAGLAVLGLAIPITYEIGVGNVNAFLLLGAVVFWRLLVAGRDGFAGALLAVLVAVKLTPVVLLLWLLAVGRRTALVAFVVAGAVCLDVSVLGGGIDAHRTYLEVLRMTSAAGASELSLAGLARSAGVDPGLAGLLPTAALALGCLLVVLLRQNPGASFAVAAVTLVVAWPVININTPALLLVALAPAAWPMGATRPEAPQRPHGSTA